MVIGTHLKQRTLLLAWVLLTLSSGMLAAQPFGQGGSAGSRTWTASQAECWQDPSTQRDLPTCHRNTVPDQITLKLLFEFDRYLVPETVVNREVLQQIDSYIDMVQRSPAQEEVTIVGHTDAKGSDAYNIALGLRRANAVRDYFIARGYPENLLAPAQSRGKRELLSNYDPFSVEQRRVVITKIDR
jgi:OOP family OmpA-OmpF porin